MRLTTFTDYTLRVLMYLAIDADRQATIPEIAAAYGISENHLMKVVHQLVRGGLVESIRGKGGGILLALAASDIRLGEVVRKAEGERAIVECLSPEDRCAITPVCRLTRVLAEAFAALYATLDRYTLADLVGNREELQQILMPPPASEESATQIEDAGAMMLK